MACPTSSNSPYQDYNLTECGLNICPDSAVDRENYLTTYGPQQLVMSNAIDDSALYRKVCEIFEILQSGGIGPGPGGNSLVQFNCVRKNTLTAQGIDLRREDRSNLNRTPFVVLATSVLTTINMKVEQSTADWTLQVLLSDDGGTTYNIAYSKDYTPADLFDTVTGLTVMLSANDLIRIRYSRISSQGTSIRDLQVNFLTEVV